jgi:hypothetical protein
MRTPREIGEMRRALLLIVSLVVVFGCHTMRFETGAGAQGNVVEQRTSFYFWGLHPTREIDVRQHCPNGALAIREETRVEDGFADLFTLGIWSPRTTLFFCAP